jgi:hypothetical protein
MKQIKIDLEGKNKPERIIINQINSYQDFLKLRGKNEQVERQQKIDKETIKKIKEANEREGEVLISGHCYPSQSNSWFRLKYRRGGKNGEEFKLNWREGLTSQNSHFNQRTRAAIHILDIECHPTKESSIYMPEQVTPLYKYMKEKFPETVGSEYLGKEIPFGEIRRDGIRNEDMTNLSFKDGKFDIIFSLDVFEHIPRYKKTFAECYRVLNSNGKLLFTVPFNYKQDHKIRAVVSEDGSITHLLEPEYHGNPVDSKGALCFQTFGWQLLDDLRHAGFDEAVAIVYWSDYYVYLGNWQIVFLAKKTQNREKSVQT